MLGLVAPLGTDKEPLLAALSDFCTAAQVTLHRHRLSSLIAAAVPEVSTEDASFAKRADTLMTAGNDLREVRLNSVALLAAQEISRARSEASGPLIHLVDSIKHPSEVEFLRDVYRRTFFLVSLHAPKESRLRHLVNAHGLKESEAQKFIERDAKEGEAHQQRTKDCFELGDVFLSATACAAAERNPATRFLELAFGHPFHTPTRDEYGMFLAHSAGLRSASLGRQVGAALLTPEGDLIATGCNDVPKAHGGQYWPGEGDQRDFVRLVDSNDAQKNKIIERVVEALAPSVPTDERVAHGREKLRETGILDLTEYGRDVHAEMEAIMSAARMGKSTVAATLYTTTFPCHNCAKHIISSGINRVIFIEPYPKSKADQLHYDAIAIEPNGQTEHIPFESFIGVGPRRFFDLFSMHLSSGRSIARKDNTGRALDPRSVMSIRTPEPAHSIEDLEVSAANEINEVIKGLTTTRSKTDE